MDAVQRINILFPKYLDKQITEPEWEELLVWMSALDEKELMALSHSQKHLWEKAKAGGLTSAADKVNWDKVLENILQSDDEMAGEMPRTTHRVHFLKTTWFRYAAAIILLIGGVAIWYKMPKQVRHDGKGHDAVVRHDDIHPGSNKAVLTVGDKNINLASDKAGVVNKNGAFTYTDGSSIDGLALSQRLTINSISTPRGGQYHATLPDGTEVWLNAASSITFPSAFTGKERSVEITGEVYLEVAKNTKQPFIVRANGTEIRVLGTSFNINAYTDEEVVKTTLIDGSVRVSKILKQVQDRQVQDDGKDQARNDGAVVLKPGEQAVVASSSQQPIQIQPIKTGNVIAWVKGYFYFDKADIKSILRQIGRWYDLDIVYSGKEPEDVFSGKMERNIPLSGILRLLEQGNINVRVEGKKLIVL